MKTFVQYLEAKFQPHSTLKSISGTDLIHLLKELAENAFDPKDIETYHGWGGGININFGNRIFKMSVDNKTTRCPKVKDIPSIYIAFDWKDKRNMVFQSIDGNLNRPSDISSKEDSNYLVKKQLEKSSIEGMHKIQNSIIRPLSEYALAIFFYAIGERREKMYTHVLSTSGFRLFPKCDVWVPVNYEPESSTEESPVNRFAMA